MWGPGWARSSVRRGISPRCRMRPSGFSRAPCCWDVLRFSPFWFCWLHASGAPEQPGPGLCEKRSQLPPHFRRIVAVRGFSPLPEHGALVRTLERVNWDRETMNELLAEYLPILIFLGVGGVISSQFVVAAWLVAIQKPDDDELSAYESGHQAFHCTPGQVDGPCQHVAI